MRAGWLALRKPAPAAPALWRLQTAGRAQGKSAGWLAGLGQLLGSVAPDAPKGQADTARAVVRGSPD